MMREIRVGKRPITTVCRALAISISAAMEHTGQQTSQHELCDLLGVEVPLRGRQLDRQRLQTMKLLHRAEKLGVARLVP